MGPGWGIFLTDEFFIIFSKIVTFSFSFLFKFRFDAMGINDTRAKLMLKAEILKYLMHFRELAPEEVVHKAIAYLKVVCSYDRDIANW